MTEVELSHQCWQMAWVVSDIKKAEQFFQHSLGVEKFVHMDGLCAAKKDDAFHIGEPGELVFDLYLGYSAGVQIELIQPLSKNNIFADHLEKYGTSAHHIAYWVHESQLETAFQKMEEGGFPLLEKFSSPTIEAGYFDTTSSIGLYTEIVGANEEGMDFLAMLKSGNY